MNFRKATKNDLPAIVAMLADDQLGSKRENFQEPLPDSYIQAFDKIDPDPDRELIVLEDDDGEVIGTLHLNFITYLTYQGGTVLKWRLYACAVINEAEALERRCLSG